MHNLITLIIIIVTLTVALNLLKPLLLTKQYSYKSKTFLTKNELEFLSRLENALPEMRIHCQVAMSALIMPTISKSNRSQFASARGRFAQKYVDYVVQKKDTGDVIAIIELDDKTHNPSKDEARDSMLASANYKVLRFQSKKKPTTQEIRNTIFPPLAATQTTKSI